MLSAMMARSAGWDDVMVQPVEVHKYKTPTERNADCAW